jgi:predicted ATPase
MVLNEPETSLHPNLLPPLARLIAETATRTQIVVVSHASELVRQLDSQAGGKRIVLRKELGETVVEEGDAPRWNWTTR